MYEQVGGEGGAPFKAFPALFTLEDLLQIVYGPRAVQILYVQEVLTIQIFFFLYLHQKMRFTSFINYYNSLGWILVLTHFM